MAPLHDAPFGPSGRLSSRATSHRIKIAFSFPKIPTISRNTGSQVCIQDNAMVRTAAVVSWAALVLGHVHAIPTLLAHSATIDGDVLIRDPLMLHASDATPASTDCKLGDWEPASECDPATLTQVFVRKAVVAPEGNGTPCTDIRATRKCKPVHCQMGPWSMWTDCVVGGYRTRSRKMIQAPLYGGRECPHAKDKVKCRPEDCLVCAWGPWTCNPTTGNKTRSRRVERPAQLTGRKCPPLTDVEPCDPIDCVLSQDEYDDEWSECDEKGNKHKNRTILVHPLYNGKACPPPEETWKTDVGACPPEDCVVQNEEDAAYGECAQRESDKKWHKIKVLNVTKPAKYGGNCPSEANRTREAECPPEPCVMGNWTFEGDCKANGKRTRTRKVVKQAKYGADACTEEEDEATDKDTCPPVDCQLQTESEVDFGNCTSIDGKSYAKNKTLVIKIPAQYGGSECNETSKVITVICNPVDCVMSDWTFEGECEDNGKRKRTRTVLQQAKNGAAECKPEEDYAPDPKTCPPQNCILDDASTCSFGECTLGENNIWVKTKVITIKTPAKFGGVDCPSEGNRTITQVCDPVPCTMSSWMFVGSCNERGERKKIRTVKAQGKYGAPACKNQFKYERDPTGCPATDCVLSTTEWTAWGECIKGMKKRTSKIVTPAKYGGNCVPKEDTANCGIDNRTS